MADDPRGMSKTQIIDKLRHENQRLQRRIANMRATYRRFYVSVQTAMEKGRTRHRGKLPVKNS